MEELLARGQAAAAGCSPAQVRFTGVGAAAAGGGGARRRPIGVPIGSHLLPLQQATLTAAEAERVAEHLRAFDIEEYGTPAWLEQHDALQQLNLQAHLNAQAHSDEFVKEALVSHDRVTVLVRELLVAEVWRERVLPLLEVHLVERVDSVTAYQLLYQEAALANLLEVLLFHRDADEAVSEEALVELCDWCSRGIHYLATQAHQHATYKDRSAQELVGQEPLAELREKAGEVRFGAALCGLTILRYITDHMPHLSLSVLARIVSTNDTAMALLPLLERPPWVRLGKGGATEKFISGSWQAVDARERHRLTQQDGQVWLLLHNLLADGAARSKMDMSEARCEALLRLKRHFNEILLDQLPVLRNLQRVIEELAFGVNSSQPVAAPSRLIMEQVPTIRAGLLSRGDWQALAQQQMAAQFGAEVQRLSQGRLERMLRSFELMCGMEEEGARRHEAGRQGLLDTVKVDAYQLVKPGVWEWWSTYTLQINMERAPEAVSSRTGRTASAAGAGPGTRPGGSAVAADENQPRQRSSAGGNGGDAGVPAEGKRYRLLPLLESLQRALPADGKITVLYGGHTCEAQLSLPASETRDTSGLAPAVWVTVGGLAGSGLVLQLKLKRLDRPSERDKVAGVWYPYVPVGGALAVRDGLLDAVAA